MPKATIPGPGRQAGRRHNPLESDIVATGVLRQKAPKRKSKSDENADNQFIDSKASKNILQLGRELADEDRSQIQPSKAVENAFGLDSRFDDGDDQEGATFEDEEAWGNEDEIVEEIEVDPSDLETFNRFLSNGEDPLANLPGWGADAADTNTNAGGTNLADIILAKIAQHEAIQDGRHDPMAAVDDDFELPPKVVEVYTKIGMILSRYKSGKLPKPLKVLPTVPQWESILELTRPDAWTPNACYEMTRIFVSSRPIVAQRFLEMVILERVRDDIHETKKLNVHLFNALKKGLYKPSAWFKGFLFPLVGSGTCTLREAHIISAVLTRVSVPVLHSAAAIKGLCDIAAEEASAGTEGGGATNIFIKALLEKKYALPFQVIDALVFHFLRFRSVDPASVKEGDVMSGLTGAGGNTRQLPVIWHQCLLSFAQRYRNDITEDQREALLDLLLTHGHHTIGPEVRRELLAGRGRGVPLEPQGSAFDGDDTMLVD